jgi:hypothetical protein
MQRGQIQLQGIAFPYSTRDQGATVELLNAKSRDYSEWIEENHLDGDRQWGIVSQAKSPKETLLLSLTFRRVLRTRYKFQNGRIEKSQEETTEPELGEFHLRKGGLLELYSVSAKLRGFFMKSISESFGKESVDTLVLKKGAIRSLMEEAIEVGAVSITGLSNPFFTDATFAGPDPKGSKTYKELLQSGEIRSFRAKFQSPSEDSSSQPLAVSITNNCKIRFYGGQSPIAQSDIEDFAEKIASLATSPSE